MLVLILGDSAQRCARELGEFAGVDFVEFSCIEDLEDNTIVYGEDVNEVDEIRNNWERNVCIVDADSNRITIYDTVFDEPEYRRLPGGRSVLRALADMKPTCEETKSLYFDLLSRYGDRDNLITEIVDLQDELEERDEELKEAKDQLKHLVEDAEKTEVKLFAAVTTFNELEKTLKKADLLLADLKQVR